MGLIRFLFKLFMFSLFVAPSTVQVKTEKLGISMSMVEERIISGARNVLLIIQNNSALGENFTMQLSDATRTINEMSRKKSTTSSSDQDTLSRPMMKGFLTMIEEFQKYAVTNITVPFKV